MNILNRSIISFIAAGMFMASSAFADGISLGGTRLIFDGAKKSASMAVKNSAKKETWLMRFWVSPYDNNSESLSQSESDKSVPFIITPPLYRLDPESSVQLRVNKLREISQTDRESVYYLNALAIPPKNGRKKYEKEVSNAVQFAVNTRIKLFYRPAGLNNSKAVRSAPEKITVQSINKQVSVLNPSPYFVTLVQVFINGQPVNTKTDSMVPPFSKLELPSDASHGTLRFRTINDFGAMTDVTERHF
ncbi:molecular chaperone [Pantoea ananatis]|uniref:fimbrial biogenesis chaperone n=1 Tax=Pantoea ananas TaxID=553 RepID=UPI0032EE744F